jgi:hypothetical protein
VEWLVLQLAFLQIAVEVVDWTKQYGIKSASMFLARILISSFIAMKRHSGHWNEYYTSGQYGILLVDTFKASTILSRHFGKSF